LGGRKGVEKGQKGKNMEGKGKENRGDREGKGK